MSLELVDEKTLEDSCVVANCNMNRERELLGTNGYDTEIGFDPLEFLLEKANARSSGDPPVRWLDLCCGSGKALLDAADRIDAADTKCSAEIVGIDLVNMFVRTPESSRLKFIVASLSNWQPEFKFDLITCVHGLHYIGDKLKLLTNAANWLCPDGRFVTSFDPRSVRYEDSKFANRIVLKTLRDAGFDFCTKRKLLSVTAPVQIDFPLEFVGANPQAGSNYTGQPAVDSHYQSRAD